MSIDYKRNGDVVARKIAGETILVPIKGTLADMQRIFSLNPVAELIWEELDGQKSLEEIQEEVVNRFKVSHEEAKRDTQEFIDELVQAELIVKED